MTAKVAIAIYLIVVVTAIVFVILLAPGIVEDVFPDLNSNDAMLAFLFVVIALILLTIGGIMSLLFTRKIHDWKQAHDDAQPTNIMERLWVALGGLASRTHRQCHAEFSQQGDQIVPSPVGCRDCRDGDPCQTCRSVAVEEPSHCAVAYLQGQPWPRRLVNEQAPSGQGPLLMCMDYDARCIYNRVQSKLTLDTLLGTGLALTGLVALFWIFSFGYFYEEGSGGFQFLPAENLTMSLYALAAFTIAVFGLLLMISSIDPRPLEETWAYTSTSYHVQQEDGALAHRIQDTRFPLETGLTVSRDLCIISLAVIGFLEVFQLPKETIRDFHFAGSVLLVLAVVSRRFLWSVCFFFMSGDQRFEHLEEVEHVVRLDDSCKGQTLTVPSNWFSPASNDGIKAGAVTQKVSVMDYTLRVTQMLRQEMSGPRLFLETNTEDRYFRIFIDVFCFLLLLIGSIFLALPHEEEIGGFFHLRDRHAWYFWPVILLLTVEILFAVYCVWRLVMALYDACSEPVIPIVHRRLLGVLNSIWSVSSNRIQRHPLVAPKHEQAYVMNRQPVAAPGRMSRWDTGRPSITHSYQTRSNSPNVVGVDFGNSNSVSFGSAPRGIDFGNTAPNDFGY
jgi:hypothetical protein